MRTLFLWLLFASPLYAGGGYGFTDSKLNEEFDKNYYEHKYPNWVNARGSSVTVQYVDASTGTFDNLYINGSSIGRGRIVQVVSTTTITNVVSTSAAYIESTLSRQITPLTAGSTIYIFISQTVEPYQNVTTANPVCYMQITRDGTALIEYQNAFANNETGDRTTLDLYFINGITWIDSPNTTSAVRYGTQFQNASASGQCYTQDGGKSSMILMEVQ